MQKSCPILSFQRKLESMFLRNTLGLDSSFRWNDNGGSIISALFIKLLLRKLPYGLVFRNSYHLFHDHFVFYTIIGDEFNGKRAGAYCVG